MCVCVRHICECMCICVGGVCVFTSYECVGATTSCLAVEGAQSGPQPILISSSSSLPFPSLPDSVESPWLFPVGLWLPSHFYPPLP